MRSIAKLVPLLFASAAYCTAAMTSLGCFDGTGSLESLGSYTFQSQGYCQSQCSDKGCSVGALQGSECWCGDEVPTTGQLSADSCDTPCPGYAAQVCGGDNAWSYFQIGNPASVSSAMSTESDATTTTTDMAKVASSTAKSAMASSPAGPNSTVSGVTPVNATASMATLSATTGSLGASATPSQFQATAVHDLASFNGILGSLLATAMAAFL